MSQIIGNHTSASLLHTRSIMRRLSSVLLFVCLAMAFTSCTATSIMPARQLIGGALEGVSSIQLKTDGKLIPNANSLKYVGPALLAVGNDVELEELILEAEDIPLDD